jgi:hypothetical protein
MEPRAPFDGESLSYADEQHSLFAADTVFARHSGQRGKNPD